MMSWTSIICSLDLNLEILIFNKLEGVTGDGTRESIKGSPIS